MATIPQLRNRLLEGFSEKQADLLAHVVIEAHDDLVNRADFHALTGVVRELADAQKDLADAQKELADSQKELTVAQNRTEGTLTDVVKTQQKMATCSKIRWRKTSRRSWAVSFAGAACWIEPSLSRASRDDSPKRNLPT
jgi:capsule polysaccharide export protein KpsE/RkpR